jgi:hypothetical protein
MNHERKSAVLSEFMALAAKATPGSAVSRPAAKRRLFTVSGSEPGHAPLRQRERRQIGADSSGLCESTDRRVDRSRWLASFVDEWRQAIWIADMYFKHADENSAAATARAAASSSLVRKLATAGAVLRRDGVRGVMSVALVHAPPFAPAVTHY